MLGPQARWNGYGAGKQPAQPPAAAPVDGSSAGTVGGGLANLGNTCFMNAVLQCLIHTPQLNRYCERRQHSSKCRQRTTRPQAFCLGCSLEELMHRTFSRGVQSATFAPRAIANALPEIAKGFHLGRQEDAHEFVRYVLDRLTKEFPPLAEGSRPAGVSGRATAVQVWFGGALQSQICCLTCAHESNTFDPFLDLSLELSAPGGRVVGTLDDAMRLFCKEEYLEGENAYKCERCATLRRARKQFLLDKAPKFLTVRHRISRGYDKHTHTQTEWSERSGLGLGGVRCRNHSPPSHPATTTRDRPQPASLTRGENIELRPRRIACGRCT